MLIRYCSSIAPTSLIACLFASVQASAQTTPTGLWKSIDDATGKPRAEIRITQAGDIFTGRIERNLLPVAEGTTLLCTLCPDERKNKPMIGLDIIRNVKPSNDAQVWEGGEILDPDKGKIYRLRLQMQDGGKKLQVRGYIGPFYRNQTWIRIA